MATTYTLKRKYFALLANGGGKSISQFKEEFNAFKAKNPGSTQSFTEWYNGTTKDLVKKQAAAGKRFQGNGSAVSRVNPNVNSALGQTNSAIQQAEATRSATRNAIKSNPNIQNRMAEVGKTSRQAGFNAGMKAGKNSATLNKQVLQNTWKGMSGAGKAGVIAGGALLAGAAIKGIAGGNKNQ